MPKQKHRHIIEATITLAAAFDPGNLEQAAAIQKQFQTNAAAMSGFRSVTTRMTKEPVPEEAKPATSPASDGLDIPAHMRRK